MNKEDTMILLYVNANGQVAITDLTDLGKEGLDDSENFSPEGHWNDWSDYTDAENMLTILAKRFNV